MSDLQDLARRVAALEAVEAIKTLKYRYFFNCDQKNPRQVRECFADGPVAIDYGRIGAFDDADAMVAIFEQLACAEHIVEMHHAQNPQIELLGEEHARGTWGLYYFMIDTHRQVCTQLGGYYLDEYVKQNDEWKISATAFHVTSSQIISVEEGLARVIFAGKTAPTELDDPSQQAQ